MALSEDVNVAQVVRTAFHTAFEPWKVPEKHGLNESGRGKGKQKEDVDLWNKIILIRYKFKNIIIYIISLKPCKHSL